MWMGNLSSILAYSSIQSINRIPVTVANRLDRPLAIAAWSLTISTNIYASSASCPFASDMMDRKPLFYSHHRCSYLARRQTKCWTALRILVTLDVHRAHRDWISAPLYLHFDFCFFHSHLPDHRWLYCSSNREPLVFVAVYQLMSGTRTYKWSDSRSTSSWSVWPITQASRPKAQWNSRSALTPTSVKPQNRLMSNSLHSTTALLKFETTAYFDLQSSYDLWHDSWSCSVKSSCHGTGCEPGAWSDNQMASRDHNNEISPWFCVNSLRIQLRSI